MIVTVRTSFPPSSAGLGSVYWFDDGDKHSWGYLARNVDGVEVDQPAEPADDPYARALAALGCTRPHMGSPVLAAVRDGWDYGDPWGSGMSVLGAICDLLAMLDRQDVIPESAGYRRAVGDTRTIDDELDPDDDSWDLITLRDAYLARRFDVDDLARAARIVDRYLDLVRAAGRDY